MNPEETKKLRIEMKKRGIKGPLLLNASKRAADCNPSSGGKNAEKSPVASATEEQCVSSKSCETGHVETNDDEIAQVAEKNYTFDSDFSDEIKAMGLGAALKLVMKTQDARKKAYYVETMKILIEGDMKRKRSDSPNESASKKAKLEKNKKGKKDKRKEEASSSSSAPKVEQKPNEKAGSSKAEVDDKKPRDD